MCQLIYSNLKDMYRNSKAVYFLATLGSERHKDGCGFICTDGNIWKSQHTAKNITNLGEILFNKIVDDEPVPFHIRMATSGIEVNKENAHPFIGKHFILMHNGTLVGAKYEDGEVKPVKKDSDSFRFLKALDKTRDKNPDMPFVELFNSTMENYAGKFAFIIREIATKTDYIIRGKTADLWISYMRGDKNKRIGYLIDTSKDVLESVTFTLGNLFAIDGENFSFDKPVLLQQETIFRAEELDVKSIGKTVEKEPPKKPIVVQENYARTATTSSHSAGGQNNNIVPVAKDVDIYKIVKYADRIYNFLSNHSLTLLDLQLMIMATSKISLREVVEEDIVTFIDYLIPKLSADKDFRLAVSAELNHGTFPQFLYAKYNLEYPWMVNKKEDVLNALRDYKKS